MAITTTIANATATNTTVIDVQCNTGQYTASNPFTISLAFVYVVISYTTHLINNDYSYHDISPYPDAFAYGHDKYNINNITASDCSIHINIAIAHINDACAMRMGKEACLLAVKSIMSSILLSCTHAHVCTHAYV